MDERVWDQEDFDRFDELTSATFEGLVGTAVPLVDVGPELTIRAVERHGQDERPFDVLLTGPRDLELPQGMHAVDVRGVGVVPLFVVPDLPAEHASRYVASFG